METPNDMRVTADELHATHAALTSGSEAGNAFRIFFAQLLDIARSSKDECEVLGLSIEPFGIDTSNAKDLIRA